MDLLCHETMPSPDEVREMVQRRIEKADILQVHPYAQGVGSETVRKTWEHLGCDGANTEFENCKLVELCLGRSVWLIHCVKSGWGWGLVLVKLLQPHPEHEPK